MKVGQLGIMGWVMLPCSLVMIVGSIFFLLVQQKDPVIVFLGLIMGVVFLIGSVILFGLDDIIKEIKK